MCATRRTRRRITARARMAVGVTRRCGVAGARQAALCAKSHEVERGRFCRVGCGRGAARRCARHAEPRDTPSRARTVVVAAGARGLRVRSARVRRRGEAACASGRSATTQPNPAHERVPTTASRARARGTHRRRAPRGVQAAARRRRRKSGCAPLWRSRRRSSAALLCEPLLLPRQAPHTGRVPTRDAKREGRSRLRWAQATKRARDRHGRGGSHAGSCRAPAPRQPSRQPPPQPPVAARHRARIHSQWSAR